MNPETRMTDTNSFRFYKRQQAEISRRRLFPMTAFYTFYSVIMFALASRSAHPLRAVCFYLAGIPVWTLVEYFSHRYILHGRFQKSKHWYKNWYKSLANKYLDPLHWEHHARPTDGLHISGELKDLLPLFAVAAPLSFIFPAFTASMLLAGVVQSYIAEEWIHHSLHYYNFRNPYFRHIKGYHLYHHSSHGMTQGYGITSGVWDIVFQTRFPANIRQKLSVHGREKRLNPQAQTSEGLDIAARGL